MKIELNDELATILLERGDSLDTEMFFIIAKNEDEKLEFYKAFSAVLNKIREVLPFKKNIELNDEIVAVLLKMEDRLDTEMLSIISENEDENFKFYKALSTLLMKVFMEPYYKRNAEAREKNRGGGNRKSQEIEKAETSTNKEVNISLIFDVMENEGDVNWCKKLYELLQK